MKAMCLFFYLMFFSFGIDSAKVWAADWDFDRIEVTPTQATVYFKSPATAKPWVIPYAEVKWLGSFRAAAGAVPVFFIAAKNGKEERSIYAFRGIPDSKEFKDLKPQQFVFPGKIIDPKSRQTLSDSRAFLGHCVASIASDVFVVYQREFIDRRRGHQPSVLLVQNGTDHLSEVLIENKGAMPRLDRTLKLVKAKQCTEVEGRNRLMLAKPLDLTPRHDDDSDDDDNDDEVTDASASGSEGDAAAAPPVAETPAVKN